MNAADVLVSLFGVLTLFMGIFVVFGMIYYIILPVLLSSLNAKRMDRRQKKRFNKNKYSNL